MGKRGPQAGVSLPNKLKKRGNPNPPNNRKKPSEINRRAKPSKFQAHPTDSRHKNERIVNLLDRVMVARYISQNLTSTTREIEKKIEDAKKGVGDTSVFEHAICQIMLDSALQGDQYKMDFLLDRLIGKVKQEVSLTKGPYSEMSDEELLALKNDLTESNRAIIKRIETHSHLAITLKHAENIMSEPEGEVIEVAPVQVSDDAGTV